MTLDEIFIKYGTDKSEHGYAKYYEEHLPKSVNKFLEIGCWHGAGVRSFKEWYNDKGGFWTLERYIDGHGLASPMQLQPLGINYYDIDHDRPEQLEWIKEVFTVICEDASHHFDSQINIFRRLFIHNLESGGLYVIEDVFDDVYWGRGLITDFKQNIRWILKRYQESKKIESFLITPTEAETIEQMIDDVFVYDEIVFIKKK